MVYGREELRYAEPFAEALVNDPSFRSWLLRKTKFANYADEARLLHREMQEQRSAGTKYWWRSHYTEACRCFGCSGQETDVLAIFEIASVLRFAIHVEVKHPGDRFKDDGRQAAAYPVRAKCWSTPGKTPPKVLPHADATTVLLCSRTKLAEYTPHLRHFDAVVTFEDMPGIQQAAPITIPQAASSPRKTGEATQEAQAGTGWDLERIRKLKPTERHALWANAKRLAAKNEQAKMIVNLIENSGLDYWSPASVRLDDAMGKAMEQLIFSADGKRAAFEATARGLPALAGVDSLIARALGKDYGKQNEATIQAGYLVTRRMEQSGYQRQGQASLPPDCVARTGLVFIRRSAT